MTGRRRALACLLASVGVVVAGCATPSGESTDRAVRALAQAEPPTTTAAPASEPCDKSRDTWSYPPLAPLPEPGAMPEGSGIREIADRPEGPDRKLKVGVDENTLQLSARDPGDQHELKGFEVDLARELADAILGDRNAVQLVPLVTEQKVPFVEDGRVDLTISAVSMTCDRWQHVDFSSEYLTTYQTVLLRADSPVTSLDDLAGRKVCVTSGGTTFGKIEDYFSKHPELRPPRKVERFARTDCLLALQDGSVDAFASHATILYGLHEQDPDNTKILLDNRDLGEQHYGIAVPKSDDHAFASFVNGVLARLRADHKLERLYDEWIGVMPPGTATLPGEAQDVRS